MKIFKDIRHRLKPCLQRLYTLGALVATLLLFTGMGAAPNDTPSRYEDRIRAHFRANRWAEGGAVLDSALHEYPLVSAFYELKGQHILHDIESGTKTAKTSSRSKSYELARYYLIKSIELSEKNLNSRRLLLRIETETKHYSSAIVYCNELLEETPYNEHLWRTKIDLYRKMGNDLEADRLLERLLTIYHDDVNLRKDVAERKLIQSKQQRENGDLRGMEESLRQLIELERDSASHYHSLIGLLYGSGRLEEAAEVAERGVLAVSSRAQKDTLIAKRVGLLAEMNRYTEAQNYLQGKRRTNPSAYLSRISNELDIEVARRARLNDPYEAYAKVYENQHSQEALNYLIGTSIQRGYHDDALYYIREARKQHDTPKLHYQEYLVLKRMGHTKKAEDMLKELYERAPDNMDVAIELAGIYLNQTTPFILQGQYNEAIPILQYVCSMKVDREMTYSARTRLINCYLQTKRYELAETILDDANEDQMLHNYVVQKAMILNMKEKTREALALLVDQYHALPESMEVERKEISFAYEEIAVPYIKSLVAAGMTNAAENLVAEALQVCPESNEILRYAISLSLARHKEGEALLYTRMGMEYFPNDPYYKLKNAQLMIQENDFRASIDSLRSLLDVYPGDSTIIMAFTDCSENLAQEYMKDRNNEMALQILDTALYFNPDSHALLYTKSLVYKRMKDWKNAEACLKGYKPDFRELSSHKRSLEELANRQMLNSASLEYQRARLGSEDAITANAYASYTRKMPRITRNGEKRSDALTFSLAYAGRDGKASDENVSDLTKGGTGVQLTGAWEHQFNARLTGRAEAGWSNRYFPTFVANLSAAYDMKNDWQLTARANFRWLKTYTGIYNMVNEFAGYDSAGNPIYSNVMKLTDWTVRNKPMGQVGVGASKTLGDEERFNVSGGLDAFALSGNFYVNANAKLQFFPLQDKHSFIFAQAGLGTAPESSLIDQSLAVGFSDLNTFTSMGARYFVNRYISLGLSGSWYTLLTQKETLTLPLNGTTAQTTKNYGNYFYVHTSLQLNF